MTTPSLFAAFAVVFCIVIPASGQDTTIQIRAVLNDPAKPDAKFFIGKVGESLVPLKLADEGFTEPQKITPENGSLNLFSSATVDKNNPQASLAATVKVPPGATSLIVIIIPAPQGTPYRMAVLEDDPKSFPWGQSKAVNLTPVDFALEVGEHKISIPSGKIIPVPKVTKLDEYNRTQTNFYYKQGNQWVVAAERQMQYVGTLRRVFLIYKAPAAVGPDVRTIVDQPPPDFEKKQ
jgi:hypothetical protein